jgi:hypothetical protein
VPSQGEELEVLEVKEHHHHYNCHRSKAELFFQLFCVAIAAQNFQKLLSLQAHYSRARNILEMSFLLITVHHKSNDTIVLRQQTSRLSNKNKTFETE